MLPPLNSHHGFAASAGHSAASARNGKRSQTSWRTWRAQLIAWRANYVGNDGSIAEHSGIHSTSVLPESLNEHLPPPARVANMAYYLLAGGRLRAAVGLPRTAQHTRTTFHIAAAPTFMALYAYYLLPPSPISAMHRHLPPPLTASLRRWRGGSAMTCDDMAWKDCCGDTCSPPMPPRVATTSSPSCHVHSSPFPHCLANLPSRWCLCLIICCFASSSAISISDSSLWTGRHGFCLPLAALSYAA